MSSQGPTHSLASIAPALSERAISPPGTFTTIAPIRRSTSAPRPGMRYRSPLNASGEAILVVEPAPHLGPGAAAEQRFDVERAAQRVPQLLTAAVLHPREQLIGRKPKR